jgi:hypothetical protein
MSEVIAKGKRVVLVDSENPWFVNKENTEIVKYIKPNDFIPAVNKPNFTFSPYKSSMKYDFSKRDLGLGYSYKQRYQALEHFNLNDESNNKYVLILSLVLILLIVLKN